MVEFQQCEVHFIDLLEGFYVMPLNTSTLLHLKGNIPFFLLHLFGYLFVLRSYICKT